MYSSAVLGRWTFWRIASPYSFLLRTTVVSDGVDWSLMCRVVPHLNGGTDLSGDGCKNFIGLTNESPSPTQKIHFNLVSLVHLTIQDEYGKSTFPICRNLRCCTVFTAYDISQNTTNVYYQK